MNCFDDFKHFVKFDHDIRSYSSFKIGGTVSVFAEPGTQAELQAFYQVALHQKLPIFILGGGYNLITSPHLKAVVIYTGKLNSLEIDEEYLHIECGVSNAKLVATAAARSLSGVECLAGIPGSIGGSIQMNAGGGFGDISDTLREVTVIDKDGKILQLTKSDIDFDYRDSGLEDFLITKAIFKLHPSRDRLAVKEETHRIMQLKTGSQPFGAKSAGCIFKNPANDSAGKLIDEAGLKNYRVGGAVVSDTHANFIINDNDATFTDITTLITHIQNTVTEQFQIKLNTEVKIWSTD